MQNAADTTVVISGWHRMSYDYADHTMMSTELENCIRRLHSIAGNAITGGRYMVFGVGSSQLLNAAVYALSSGISSSPSKVFASTPFYSVTSVTSIYIILVFVYDLFIKFVFSSIFIGLQGSNGVL